MISVSSLSLEFIRYAVKAIVNGVSPYNPTGDVVRFAFTTGPNVAPTTWYVGSWETSAGPVYIARCLVGPAGAATLAVGTYTVWLKITDNPEVPVRQVGQLKVY